MDWVEPVTMEGQVVRLEPLAARHAPGLLAAANPDLFRFTPQGPKEWSVEGFERDVAWVNSLPESVAFAVVMREDGRVAGRTTYMDIRAAHRGLEIGRTWIGREFQGTRVNPEMKFLMLRHAFEGLRPSAVRVALITGISNEHSQRAIAKLGAVREGVMRKDRVLPDGSTRNSVVFSITDDEWPVVKRGLAARMGWGV